MNSTTLPTLMIEVLCDIGIHRFDNALPCSCFRGVETGIDIFRETHSGAPWRQPMSCSGVTAAGADSSIAERNSSL